jgi:hypothetical protein
MNTRRYVVLTTAVLAIVVTYGQLFSGWGQSQAQLSATGDSTLKVAGYAFSIWSVLFAGVLVYAVYQFLPTAKADYLSQRFGWPASITFIALTVWVVASAMDWKIATVVLIFIQLISLLTPLWIFGPAIRELAVIDKSRTRIVWPIGLLAGWLTIAAPLNLITVATALHALPDSLSPNTWAILTIILVVLVAIIVTARINTMAYCLPIVWGLIGAYTAEHVRNPSLAYMCLGAAVLVLLGSLAIVFRRAAINLRQRHSGAG